MQDKKELEEELNEFIKNGGVVQQIERNVSGYLEGQSYGNIPRKAGRPAAVKEKSPKKIK